MSLSACAAPALWCRAEALAAAATMGETDRASGISGRGRLPVRRRALPADGAARSASIAATARTASASPARHGRCRWWCRSETLELIAGTTATYDKTADSGRIVRMHALRQLRHQALERAARVARTSWCSSPARSTTLSWAVPAGNIWTDSALPWVALEPDLPAFPGPAAVARRALCRLGRDGRGEPPDGHAPTTSRASARRKRHWSSPSSTRTPRLPSARPLRQRGDRGELRHRHRDPVLGPAAVLCRPARLERRQSRLAAAQGRDGEALGQELLSRACSNRRAASGC